MTERQDRRPKARLRFARLRHQPIIENVEYRAPRDLDRTLFQKLAQGVPTMGRIRLVDREDTWASLEPRRSRTR